MNRSTSPRRRRANQSTPSAKQVAAKTVTYRVVTAAQSVVLAWILFGDLFAGGMFAVVDNVISGGLYAAFEVVWARSFKPRGFSRNRRRFLLAR